LELTHPDLLTKTPRHVAVETAGTLTRGMTAIDQRTLVERPPPNCDVLTGIDDDAAFAVILEAIQHFSA
jgi:inosine-uridine nucleoside N-ribohydrolase